MTVLTKALTRAEVALQTAVHRAGARGERGDVPGWVMVTLMTAGLVAVLWTVADDQLRALFGRAMNTVSGP